MGSNVSSSYIPKSLIVLDFNGVLFWRHHKSYDKKSIPNDMKSLDVVSCKSSDLYKRRYLDYFLATCYERYDVAFYSSITEPNGKSILPKILANYQKGRTIFTWYRDKCEPDPSGNEYATTKSINLIKDEYPEYGDRIIICDDSPSKVRFNDVKNVITVSPFTSADSEKDKSILIDLLDEIEKKFKVL